MTDDLLQFLAASLGNKDYICSIDIRDAYAIVVTDPLLRRDLVAWFWIIVAADGEIEIVDASESTVTIRIIVPEHDD